MRDRVVFVVLMLYMFYKCSYLNPCCVLDRWRCGVVLEYEASSEFGWYAEIGACLCDEDCVRPCLVLVL